MAAKKPNWTTANFGCIFRNKFKDRDTEPDYTGKMDVEGREYRLAGWIRTPENGGPNYIYVKLTAPEEMGARRVVPRPDEDPEREVPF